MITNKASNVVGKKDFKNRELHQVRVDVTFDAMVSYLRTFHDNASWWVEERSESIGVYVSSSKQLREIVHAFGQGWKALMNQDWFQDIRNA